VVQELGSLASIFAGDQVNFTEDSQSSQSDIFKVANGSGYYE
jgi:hypothetical protein